MEAPRDVDDPAEVHHISGPLLVIYRELEAKIMCYEATDNLLKKLEESYKQAWMKRVVFDEEKANEALQRNYDRWHLNYSGSCCYDYAVYLGDLIDVLNGL